jgi:hypothetical protein
MLSLLFLPIQFIQHYRRTFCEVVFVLLVSPSIPLLPHAYGQKTELPIERVDSETSAAHTTFVGAHGGTDETNEVRVSDTDPNFSFAYDGGIAEGAFDPHAYASGNNWGYGQSDDGRGFSEVVELVDMESEGHAIFGSWGESEDRFGNQATGWYEIGDPGGGSPDVWIEGCMTIILDGRNEGEPNPSYEVFGYGRMEIGDSYVEYISDPDGGFWYWGRLQDLDGPHYIDINDPIYVPDGVEYIWVRQYVEPEDIVKVNASVGGRIRVAAGAYHEYDWAALWNGVTANAEMEAYYGVPD